MRLLRLECTTGPTSRLIVSDYNWSLIIAQSFNIIESLITDYNWSLIIGHLITMIISYDHWFWLLQLIIDYNWSLIIGNFRLGSFVWEFSFGIFRLGTFAWEFSLGNFVINQWAIICKLSTIMNWTCVSVCCNNLAVALLSLQKFGSSKMEAQTIICLRQCLPHTLLCLG